MGDDRLPKRVVLGELDGGKGSSGVQENEWMECLKSDVQTFGIPDEEWVKACSSETDQLTWRAEELMRRWRDTERGETTAW